VLAKKQNPLYLNRGGFVIGNNRPGIELFSRGATPKLSSPQQRFTSEFGKGSVWFHRAIDTKKNLRAWQGVWCRGKEEFLSPFLPVTCTCASYRNPEDCKKNEN
jgi:hypothetical protein